MSRRVGRRQLEQLGDQLSPRDLAVLGSTRRFRLVTGDQLRRLHFRDHATPETGARVARRVLSRLAGHGLLVRLERRIGGIRAGSAGHIYALSSLGHRALGTEIRKRTTEPSFTFVKHTLAITELSTTLIELDAADQIDLLELQPEPAAWRTHRAGLVENILKPDLFVQVADDEYELSWFIEIDCGTESRPTIQRKCHAYADYRRTGAEQERHGVFPLVLWIAPDERRRAQLEQAITGDRRIDPDLFVVTTSNKATEVITDTGRQP
ncbi:MAG: replication-relaxation family protein [Acidimicrobiales bacterium]|nr:replication-relaxation family protein [Acidimicrobiales bacterium]